MRTHMRGKCEGMCGEAELEAGACNMHKITMSLMQKNALWNEKNTAQRINHLLLQIIHANG